MKRTTRILSLFLAVALLCGLLPQLSLLAGAEEIHSGYCGAEDDGSNLQWSFDEQSGLLTITGSGDMADYNYHDAPWSRLESNITAVSLPEGLTSIGSYAFIGFDCLTSVTIPDSVLGIGGSAFAFCDGLTSLSLGNSVVGIGGSAFVNCSALSSVTFPDSVMFINDHAFSECTALSSVSLGNSVTQIGSCAFDRCNSLTSVTIPDSVTFIGPSAFGYYYNDDTCQTDKVPDFIIYGYTGNPAQEYAEKNEFPFVSLGEASHVISGICGAEGVGNNLTWTLDTDTGLLTVVGSGPMSDTTPFHQYCDQIKAVSLPEGLTSIGQRAFYDCSALTSVYIPGNVTSIGEYAFGFCGSLTSVTIPDSLRSIGSGTFYQCTALTSAAIPNGVTDIGNWVFYNCKALKSVTLPDSVTSIGNSAFYQCTSLTGVTIPNSVTSIGNSAFYLCTSLTGVTIPNSVTSIGQYAFEYCTALTSMTIPASVTSIGSGAFAYCKKLTSISVATDHSSFESLDGVLFNKSKTELIQYPAGKQNTTYEIPAGVTRICESAFYRCNFLTSVIIPDSVTQIDKSAFAYCTSMTNATISNGLTSIGDTAFLECSSLTDMTIPASVTSIGDGAFLKCAALTDVTIPAGITSMGSSVFSGCAGLTSATISNGITCIGEHMFSDCTALTNVTIPASVSVLQDYAFSKCTSLADVTLPANMSSIGKYAFYKCTALERLVIPEGVTEIPDHMLYECSVLTEVTIPDSVTCICDYAFDYCGALKSVTIPGGVQSIGRYAFENCGALTSVTIPSSVTSIGYRAFGYKGFSKVDGFTVYGCEGSAAQAYAEKCGFTFVSQSKPVITNQPASASVVRGKAASFTVAAEGENLRYQWQYKKLGASGWINWSGKTEATLRLNGTGTNNGCQYRCVVTNEAGSVISEAATLTVISKPVITAQPDSASVVRGKAASFTVAAEGENLRYQWQYKKLGASGWTKWTGKTEATLRLNGTGTNNGCQYRCVVTNEAGSVISEAATLTVISKPVITAQPDSASVVRGKAVSFTVAAEGENLRYQWQYKKLGASGWTNWSGKTEATLRLKGTGTNNGCQYRCVVSNEAGFVISEAATLRVLAP